MQNSQKQNSVAATPARHKSRRRFHLYIYLLILVVLILMLFHKPAYYRPVVPANNKQLSSYLTHQLIPHLYNSFQLQQPFDVVITQEELNGIISKMPPPKESKSVKISYPAVNFSTGQIRFAAIAAIHGADLVITIEIDPRLDEKGLLNVKLAKVKIGAMPMTIAARIIASRMYKERLAAEDIDPCDIRTLLAAALFENRPFDPVFIFDDKKARLDKITVSSEKLTLHLTPVPETQEAINLKY